MAGVGVKPLYRLICIAAPWREETPSAYRLGDPDAHAPECQSRCVINRWSPSARREPPKGRGTPRRGPAVPAPRAAALSCRRRLRTPRPGAGCRRPPARAAAVTRARSVATCLGHLSARLPHRQQAESNDLSTLTAGRRSPDDAHRVGGAALPKLPRTPVRLPPSVITAPRSSRRLLGTLVLVPREDRDRQRSGRSSRVSPGSLMRYRGHTLGPGSWAPGSRRKCARMPR